MEQPHNRTDKVDNNTSEYETIRDQTAEIYDTLEMQPYSTQVAVNVPHDGEDGETGNELFSNEKRKSLVKKSVCIGIFTTVITAVVVAVMVYVFMSSRTEGGSCKTHTNIENGQIIRSTGVRHGDILEVRCDRKSKLNGSNTIICLSTGTWSADTNCALKDCGAFVLTHNMQFESETNRTTVGSVITLSCKNGFTLSGNNSVICQEDEKWSKSPTCSAVDCGPPNIITNSKQISVETTTYNSSFIVECVKGHVLIGSERVACNIDGQWDEPPICDIVSCGIPNIPAHASITNLSGTSFQSRVSMKCNEGYSMYGNPVINCTSSGNWTDLPTCKRTDFCESSPCQNGSCVSNGNNYSCICSEGFAGLRCENVITDCFDILNQGETITDGVYTIKTWKTHQKIRVYCDMTTTAGGWTVIQHRFNKSVDFYRNFSEYENGFGDLTSEFWLGLKYIQEIASQSTTHLRIDVEADNGTGAFETFNMFKLSSRPAYTLYLGDTILSHRIHEINRFGKSANGTGFSTFDHDVDTSDVNCASQYHGGWWYNACFGVDLNGREMYYHGFIFNAKLKSSKMMIRRN